MSRQFSDIGWAPLLTSEELRRMGRSPPSAFRICLEDGSEVRVNGLLRVLPGKRIVGKGDWGGSGVLAKIFVSSDSSKQAARERQGLEALQDAGLPVPELLLSAAVKTGGSVVLTEFLAGAVSLADAWEALPGLPSGEQQQLQSLRPAFRLLGRMHAAGLKQDDLHPGNFLLHDGQCFVIDGDAVCASGHSGGLNDGEASANLALLMAQLPVEWDRFQPELVGFYRESQAVFRPQPGELARLVEQARQLRLRRFLAKTGRDCTQFSVSRTVLCLCVADRSRLTILSGVLEDPDAAIGRERIIKDGGTCTVARFELPECSLVIKRYNLKNSLHALSRSWRPSRAWHSWRAGHMLLHLGIATPRPLALIEERFGPLRRRAFLVNEYCPGTSLQEHLSPNQPPGDAEARSLLSLFDALYRMKISHGDLKATNLLWHEGRVVLIDLDGMRRHVSASGFARAWRRDRARLLANWPPSSVLFRWLDERLEQG